MKDIGEKLELVSTRLDFLESAALGLATDVTRLGSSFANIRAKEEQIIRLNSALANLEAKAFGCYELSIRWFLDLQLNIWLGAIARIVFDEGTRTRIEADLQTSIGFKISSASYDIKSFSDREVSGRAPTNSVVLKVSIVLEQNSTVVIFAPLYIRGDPSGGLRVTSASRPTIETNASVGRLAIEKARVSLRDAIDRSLKDPIDIPVQNPLDPKTPMVFRSVFVQADVLSLFPEISSLKYSRSAIPYMTMRFTNYSYSLEFFKRYAFPLLDEAISKFDKDSIQLSGGLQLDSLNITKLKEYLIGGADIFCTVRLQGTILSDLCWHNFAGNYTFLLHARMLNSQQLEIYLEQFMMDAGTLESGTRGDIPNPICNLEHDGIRSFLEKLPQISLIKQQLSAVRRAELKAYPPFGPAQNVSLNLFG